MFFSNINTFRFAVFIIAIVCVYDIHLTVVFSESIDILEKNPTALYIIKNFGLYQFIIIKAISMFAVCSACLLLGKTKYKIAVYGLAILQIFLFIFLTFFTDPKTKPLSRDEFGTNPLIHIFEKIK